MSKHSAPLGRWFGVLTAAAAALLAWAAPAAAADKVRVSVLPFVSSAPLFIAVERGHFAKQDLDVELKFFTAAQPVAVAVTSGDVEFGVTATTAGFFNLAGKGTIKIVAAQSREEKGWPFNAYVASNQAHAAGLTSLDKLPGHSFGISQVGSSHHYMIGRLAEKRGFTIDKLRITPLQSVPNMIAAVKGGQIDATILPAQYANDLQAKGEAKILGWVDQETPWQLGAVFTSPKMIAEKRPVVERFVKAWQAAATEYDAQFQKRDAKGQRLFGKDADALIAIIEKHTKAKPEVIKVSLPYIDPQGRLLVRDLYEQVRWYKANKLIDADVEAKNIMDLSFVKGHLDVPK
jgi:NitT/TauT family transport system substrate-binding protein